MIAASGALLPIVAVVVIAATLQPQPAAAEACASSPSPARLSAEIDRQRGEIEHLEQSMRQRGCSSGSIIVIGGENADLCAGLARRLPAMQADLLALESVGTDASCVRNAAIGQDEGRRPSHSQFSGTAPSSHSQFRRSVVFGSVTELRLPGASETVSHGVDYEPAAALPGIDAQTSMSASVRAEPAEEFQHEVIDLETRLSERNVRVVGPQFLPDQSGAIDLRAPARSFYR
jgi:hypothetical protein